MRLSTPPSDVARFQIFTWAAVAMGARFVERHITLDRAMWGTDQAASVEVPGLLRLVANIRDIENVFLVFKHGVGYDSAKLIDSARDSVGMH